MADPITDAELEELKAGLGALPIGPWLRSTIRALIARLEAAEGGWQDIATAALDLDAEVLVTGFIWNDPSKGRWTQVASWNGIEWATEQAPLHPPTHWRPVPSLAPLTKAGG